MVQVFLKFAAMATARRGEEMVLEPAGGSSLSGSYFVLPALGTTEEFNQSTNVITAAAWSSWW